VLQSSFESLSLEEEKPLKQGGTAAQETSISSVPDISLALGLSGEFDKDDLVLKSNTQAQFDLQRYLQQDEELAYLAKEFDGGDPTLTNFGLDDEEIGLDEHDDDSEDDEDEEEGEMNDFAHDINRCGSKVEHASLQNMGWASH
jgi:hypothetical protein